MRSRRTLVPGRGWLLSRVWWQASGCGWWGSGKGWWRCWRSYECRGGFQDTSSILCGVTCSGIPLRGAALRLDLFHLYKKVYYAIAQRRTKLSFIIILSIVAAAVSKKAHHGMKRCWAAKKSILYSPSHYAYLSISQSVEKSTCYISCIEGIHRL